MHDYLEHTAVGQAKAGRGWLHELLWAIPLVALILALFYIWFAVADRYQIFLYDHDMGAGFDTSPFGRVTSSRYWMAGLVAGGAVLVPYSVLNLVLGRLRRGYRAPVAGRLWLLCALPLVPALPLLVMTVNEPVLPLGLAIQVLAATLAALGAAVALGQAAAERPLSYLVWMGDGLGPALLLLSLFHVESYSEWLAAGRSGFVVASLMMIGVALVLLLFSSALYTMWRRVEIPPAPVLLVAGVQWAYLVLPLAHYLFFSTDSSSWSQRAYAVYISDADNFFGRSGVVQLGVWLAVALLALLVTRGRRWLRGRLRRPGQVETD